MRTDPYSTNFAAVAEAAACWDCSNEQAAARIERANAQALKRAAALADKFRDLTGLEPQQVCANYSAARAGTLRLVRSADGVCRLFDRDATLWEGLVG